MDRNIIHLNLDAFIVATERKRNAKRNGKPLIVAASSLPYHLQSAKNHCAAPSFVGPGYPLQVLAPPHKTQPFAVGFPLLSLAEVHLPIKLQAIPKTSNSEKPKTAADTNFIYKQYPLTQDVTTQVLRLRYQNDSVSNTITTRFNFLKMNLNFK